MPPVCRNEIARRLGAVARVERSETRGQFPDYATLHPGYRTHPGYRFARGEPAVTGSIKRAARLPTFRKPPGRDEVYDGLPRAVPGED